MTNYKTQDSRRLRPVKAVALCGNIHQDDYVERILLFISMLLEQDIKVGLQNCFFSYIKGECGLPSEVVSLDTPSGFADAVISIGGDGTFLKTARWTGDSSIPILGLNTGHLGFLANYSIDEISDLLEVILGGQATLESRSLLELSCASMPEGFYPYALNEVAIMKEETSSMITARVTVDSDFLAAYQSDGVLVSTPTGSTAYNLSVGGPIIQPGMRCMVISPVAPHSLTLRPIVIDGDSLLEVVVESRASDFRISLDGNSFTLKCGEILKIRQAPFEILTIRRPGDNFASTLRGKLLWGKG